MRFFCKKNHKMYNFLNFKKSPRTYVYIGCVLLNIKFGCKILKIVSGKLSLRNPLFLLFLLVTIATVQRKSVNFPFLQLSLSSNDVGFQEGLLSSFFQKIGIWVAHCLKQLVKSKTIYYFLYIITINNYLGTRNYLESYAQFKAMCDPNSYFLEK